jgi:hypothetical protein
MASSVGGIIEAADYNDIRNKVIAVLGTGTGNFGYGQAPRLNSVSVAIGTTVTAAQWQGLRWDIFNALSHQNGVAPTIGTVAAGETIRFGVTHPNNAYNTLADTVVANRFSLGTGRFDTIGFGSKTETFTWKSQAYLDLTYTFSNADAARFFFNSGGIIRITSFFSGLNNPQNNAWTNLLATAGTQRFGGQEPSTGFTPLNGTNYYRLTDTFQTYYTSTSSSPYANNSYRLQARCNVAGNSLGTANIVYIRVLFTDGYVDPDVTAGFPEDFRLPVDQVNGTLTVSSDMIRPTGVMQTPPTVSTFTIVGPTSDIASASFIRT